MDEFSLLWEFQDVKHYDITYQRNTISLVKMFSLVNDQLLSGHILF